MNHQEIDAAANKLDTICKQSGIKVAALEVGVEDVGDIKYAIRQRCLRHIAELFDYPIEPGKTTPIQLQAAHHDLLEKMVAAGVDGFMLGVATKMGLKADKPKEDNYYLFN